MQNGFDEFDEYDDDDVPIDRPMAPTIGALIERRFARRELLRGMANATISVAVGAAALGAGMSAGIRRGEAAGPSSLGFKEIAHDLDPNMDVAEGYDAQVLVAWGDPILKRALAFDHRIQTAAAQVTQFGYNCDFIAFMPLPRGSGRSDHGLLCVNNEYTNWELMVPGLKRKSEVWTKTTRRQTAVEMAAHGHSVVEVGRKDDGRWTFVAGGERNRRITATTRMTISGPAAGHDRLKTKADPSGRNIIGTMNNCAGGTTPWGTVLIAEENFHYYFAGDPAKSPAYAREKANYRRYGIRGHAYYGWHKFHERFNIEVEPNEPNRFGWMVEFDPYDPVSVPVKRTALGRMKHEGADMVVAPDGRLVAYLGDDQRFEFIYKYVSNGRVDAANPAANARLLDEGTLYAARFSPDGTLEWRPLVFGHGPLTPANGFHSQADVLIETRRAADLMGATPMDRPEEVEVNRATGRVYASLTKNTKRGGKKPADAANPRARNRHGHIIEIMPPGAGDATDHTATKARWEIFLLAGDPQGEGVGAKYHPAVSREGWLANPDNFGFDKKGRMWIGSDQGPDQPKNGIADGVYATDTQGPGRALTKCFFTAPLGAELCSPTFTPDNRTLFVSVQHPAEGSGFDAPLTRWPDFKDGAPPRPAVVAITKKDGGVIGD
jgi:secreted PhoX family phosphatase